MNRRFIEACDAPEFHPAHCKCPPPYDCVFCEIIRLGNAEGFVRNAGTVVSFIPLNPVVPGHRLFVPTMHARSIREDPGYGAPAFHWAARWGQEKNEDFNLITSSGSNATQTVWHTHIHYVPRREGDGLMLPWTEHFCL
jgi:diadenosine tetraphosphate (Ap4A) HIT family hydrolase